MRTAVYAFVLVSSSPIPSMYDNHRHPTAGWLTSWLECNRLLPSTTLQKLTLDSGMSPSTQRASSSQRSESSNNQLQSPLYLWISLKEHPFLKHTHKQTHTISEGKDPNLEGHSAGSDPREQSLRMCNTIKLLRAAGKREEYGQGMRTKYARLFWSLFPERQASSCQNASLAGNTQLFWPNGQILLEWPNWADDFF